jgi:hypothetical protein
MISPRTIVIGLLLGLPLGRPPFAHITQGGTRRRDTIARLKKQKYGASSEKIAREIEQLELALEGLEIERAAADLTPEEPDDEPTSTSTERPTPRRRGKPRLNGEVIRERIVLDPGTCCPGCSGALRLVGEECPRSSTWSRPSSS